MSTIGYLHSDKPVYVGHSNKTGVYVPRVQNITMGKDIPISPVFELGRVGSVGDGSAGGVTSPVSINWIPVGIDLERLLLKMLAADLSYTMYDMVNVRPEAVSLTGTDWSFASPDQILKAGGGLLNYFRVGDTITVDSTSNLNDGIYVVEAIADGAITTVATSLTTETAVTAGSTVIDTKAMVVFTPHEGVEDPRIASLQWTFQERADMTATAQLQGTNRITSSLPTAGATPAIGSIATYKAEDIAVTVDGTAAVRCMRAVINAQFTIEPGYQLGQATPFGVRASRPVVTADLDFVHATATAGNLELVRADDADITIAVNGTDITFELTDVITSSINDSAQINGFATKRFRYQASDDGTNGGMSVTVV